MTHAAMVSDAAVISPSDAAVLKQTLDVLDATLDQVDARIAAQVIPAENRANLQVALAGVRGQLSTVRNTLSARTLAVAQQNNPAPAPTPAPTPSPVVTQVIPPALSNEGALVPNPQMIAEVPKTEVSPAETVSQPVSPETQVAAVSASANSSSRALLWFGVVCLGILGAIFFISWT
jgi:hypothetical protein